MADKKLKVEIVGDASSLKRAAGDADGAMSKFDGAMSKLGKGALAVGAGLGVATAAAFSMAEAAADDERAAAALAKTLQNAAGATGEQAAAVEDWISAQGRALGVADDDLRPALDRLVRATGDVGQAQKLASLAMDISAGTGKDLVSVSEALAKAQNGNLSALKKLDPALADLIENTGSSELALESLAQTFDGQASTAAETAAGKLQIAKLQFAEMQEEIGAKLIPILAKLADWVVVTVIPAIERLVGWVETNWPKFRAAIETGIQAIQQAWATYGQPVLDAVVGAVQGFIGIVQGAWAIFGDTIWTHIKDTFDNIKTVFSGAFEIIEGVWNTFKGLFTGDWGLMWDGIKTVLSGVWDTIKGVVQFGLDNLKAAVGLAWDGLKAITTTLIADLVTWFTELPGKILGALANLGSDLMGLASDALGVGVGFLGGLGGQLGELMNWFKELPGKIVGWVGDLGKLLFDAGKDIIQGLIDGIGNMLGSLKDKLGSVTNLIPDWKGPMRVDLKLLEPSGEAIMAGLMRGIGNEVPALQAQLGGITASIGPSVGAAPSRGAGGTVVNLNVNVDRTMDPVEVGRQILDAIDTAQRAGVRSTTLVAA